MSNRKLNICRVCLGDNANLSWNDELLEFPGTTYRDCYYKYTQIEEFDVDFYPMNLCQRCADEVRNAHDLFERAVKSYIILQNTVCAKEYETLHIEFCNDLENSIVESRTTERADVDVNEIICFSPVRDEKLAEDEYDCKKNSITQIKTEYNFASSCMTFVEQQPLDVEILMPADDRERLKDRVYLESLNSTLDVKMELEIADQQIFKSFVNKDAINKSKYSEQQLLHQIQQKRELPSEKRQRNTIRKTFIDGLKHRIEPEVKNFPFGSYSHCIDHKSEQKRELNCDSSNKKTFENTKFNQLKTEMCAQKGFNLDDCDKNILEASEPKKLVKAKFSYISAKEEEKLHRVSANVLTDQNLSENKTNLAAFGVNETNSSGEGQFLSEACDDDKMKSSKPLEIDLLKKVYENDFEKKSAKQKSKPVKRSKAREKICQYCSLVVLGKGAILNHEATHLTNRERNEVCPKCGLKFYTKESLNAHIKIHDENREKKHKCQYCEKAFYHSGARNVHQRKHLGLMVKCPMCPKEFLRQVDVDKHLPSHSASMLNNGAKRIKHKVHCQYCNKYIMTNSWKAHKAAHLKEPQVKCKLCEREFYSRNSCVNHLQKKHGKRGEYEQYVHTYNKTRMTHLMIRQQEAVEIVIE